MTGEVIRPQSFGALGSGGSCGGDDYDGVGDGVIDALLDELRRCCHGCLSGVLRVIWRI